MFVLPLQHSSSEVGAADKTEIKRRYKALIGKPVEAPEVTGREVAGWVNDGNRFAKLKGKIRDVKVFTGDELYSFFAVIGFLALDSTLIEITCWGILHRNSFLVV